MLRRGFSSPGFEHGAKSEFDQALGELVDAALDVLRHDCSAGSEVNQYERSQLQRRFAEILSKHKAS